MDLSASNVCKFVARLEEGWNDAPANIKNDRYNPSVTIIEGMQAQQTARIAKWYNLPGNCVGFDMVNFKPSGVQSTYTKETSGKHFGVPCEIEGDALDTERRSFILDEHVDAEQSVPFNICDNIFSSAEVIDMMWMELDRALTKRLAVRMAAKLKASAGTNLAGLKNRVNPISEVNNTTKVTSIAYGNANYYDWIPDIVQTAKFNKMQTPYIFDGMNLMLESVRAEIEAGTSAGDKGAKKAFGLLTRTYSDDENFSDADLDESTFLVDRGTFHLTFLSMYEGTETNPRQILDQTLFRFPSRYLRDGAGNPVMMDVTYQIKKRPLAGTVADCEFVHHFHARIWFKYDLAPNQGTGYTGVVEYQVDPEKEQVGVPRPKPTWATTATGVS